MKGLQTVAIRFFWSPFVVFLSWSVGEMETVKLDLMTRQMFLSGVVIGCLLLSKNTRGKKRTL
jgi:hypothetical protein